MFSDAHFKTQELDFRPGDALLFYSDGVTESRSPAGEEYGVARLAQFAQTQRGSAPADLVSACLGELREFSGAQPRADDVTMMALRRAA
jgi:sigma-B regulation protein RsbU (phosphoserine phosphatase)